MWSVKRFATSDVARWRTLKWRLSASIHFLECLLHWLAYSLCTKYPKTSASMKCLMDSWQFIWNVRLSNHHFFFGHHGDDAPHLWPWGTDITNVAISTALLSAYQKGRGWRIFPCCYCCWFPWTTNPGTRFSGLACGKSLHLERSSAARNSHEWTRKKTLLRTNTRHRRWWPDYQRCDMTSHHWSNVNLKQPVSVLNCHDQLPAVSHVTVRKWLKDCNRGISQTTTLKRWQHIFLSVL